MNRLRELPDGTIQKQCSKCEEWRRIPEGFPLHKSSADGFYVHCHRCCAAYKRQEYRELTEEQRRERSRRGARNLYRNGRGFEHLE